MIRMKLRRLERDRAVKMIKQVIMLCRLQLGNLFGINELMHTKDKAKKARFIGLSIVWIMLIAMVVVYVGMFSYSLVSMGMADIIPMYLTNFLLELLIMLPGLVVFGCFVKPAAGFYVVFILGSLFLPLLPLTISSVLGAMITAISSRSRHKSLVETFLMLVIVIAVLGGSLFLSDNESQFTEEMLKNMAEILSVQIGRIYPPSIWFGNALLGDMGALGLLIGVPTVIFAVFVVVLQKYFQIICTGIHAVSSKNNYKMTKLQRSSHITALWRKELKRYFASSVYVTNTVIGYVMAVIVSAGLLWKFRIWGL